MPVVKGPISILRGGEIIPAAKEIEVSGEEALDLEAKGFTVIESEDIDPKEKSRGINMLPKDEKGKIPENNGYEFSGNLENSGSKVLTGGKPETAPKMGKSSTTKKTSTVKSTVKASTAKKGE